MLLAGTDTVIIGDKNKPDLKLDETKMNLIFGWSRTEQIQIVWPIESEPINCFLCTLYFVFFIVFLFV